jgi:hypothetical protein
MAVLATACGASRSHVRHEPAATPEFGFAAAPGWHTSSTGLHPEAPQVPSVTAATIPVEDPAGSLPTETLKRLPADGIVIMVAAYTPWAGMQEFPRRELPPQLGDADVREDWEGQPRSDVPEYLILSTTNGFYLEVRVYFGTQRPSDEQASHAQAELAELRLPENDATVEEPASTRPRVRWRDSVSLGRPDRGTLARGVRFPADGASFFTWDPILHRSPDRPWRRYGNDRLVRIVLGVLGDYSRAHAGAPRVGIGDFSRPHGGPFGPKHVSHQNGLDVDVYYPRLDGLEMPPLRAGQIDRPLAQDLLDRFVAAGANRIFVGPNTHLAGPPGVVKILALHDNHMHVRIVDAPPRPSRLSPTAR